MPTPTSIPPPRPAQSDVKALAESVRAPFQEATFACSVKDVRHWQDGTMTLTLRIPQTEVAAAISVVRGYHRELTCQIQQRSTR